MEAAEQLEENEEKLAREADEEKLDRAMDVLGVEEDAKREALKTVLESVDA